MGRQLFALAGLAAAALTFASGAFAADSATYASTVLDDRPAAYWRLDETSGSTAADSSPNGVAGAYAGGPSLGVPGAVFGSPAAAFDGTRQYVEVAYAPGLNAARFSVEAWVKPSGGAGRWRTVVASRDATGSLAGYVLYAGNDDRWQFFLGRGAASWLVLAGGSVKPGVWTHLVATYDGAVARLYADGAAIAETPFTSFVPNAARPLRIGAGQTESRAAYFFPGAIDEVAVYPTALSLARIREHEAHTGAPAVDSTPPETTIDGGPSATTTETAATFAFSSSEPGSSFSCTLDDGASAACASPVTYFGLAPGPHTFSVRAIDAVGNADPTPATRGWTVGATHSPLSDGAVGDAPVAYWRLDERSGTTAADDSGNGHTGAYVGRPTLGAAGGPVGSDGAVALDGATEYVEVPYSAALNPARRFSIEAWAKVTGGGGTWRAVLTSRDASPDLTGYVLYADNDDHWQLLVGTGAKWLIVPGSAVVLNAWTHLVVTYDTWPGQVRLYVNGALAGVRTTTALLVPNTARPLRIGAGQTESAAKYFFPGSVDEVAVYDHALLPSRVAARYAQGASTHADSTPAPVNPAQRENALTGSTAWMRPPTSTVEGYASQASVAPGGPLELHVSAHGGTRYRVEVYRLGWYAGAGARLVACGPSCDGDRSGLDQPTPAPDPVTGEVRAGWQITEALGVPSDWPSGYYVAQLVATSGPDAGNASNVPFIVRAPATARSTILVVAGVNTWQAYNGWGGKSLYQQSSVGVPAVKVSFDRPYTAGGTPMWRWDYYAATPGPFDWDVQLVRFLEREGYDVSYTTDVDLDADPSQLLGHKLVVVAGHDEYWTKATHDAFDAARGAGVNLAFMGGNTAYWQVRYENDRRTLVEYRSASADPNPVAAEKTVAFAQLGRPQCELLGVTSRASATSRRDYSVVAGALGDPWLAGTGFAAGDTLPNLVGYEWDTVQPGCNVPALTTFFHYDGSPAPADAVRYVWPASGATVFSASSLQFSWGLDDFLGNQPADPRLQQFVRNAITALTR
jgi:hypothetical protein